jgi:outer membrane lipoprotein SlyB
MAMPVAMPTPAQAQSGYYQGKTWRDSRGRVRCRKKNGTVGLIVGGAAGALAGRAIDTHGERTTGTVLGAAAGALLGREVQRNSGRRGRYCR